MRGCNVKLRMFYGNFWEKFKPGREKESHSPSSLWPLPANPTSNNFEKTYPFKRQFHKTVKRTQTIRRQIADELFECVWPFCEIVAESVKVYTKNPESLAYV